MQFKALNRKIHYWISIGIALPLLVTISSGLLLQLKKQLSWVQPPEQRGRGITPDIGLAIILAAAQSVTELQVAGWQDIQRLDVRPAKGLAKVILHSGWEVQVDLGSGQVLQTAYRRSDFLEALHDGSYFAGDYSKLGLFLPSGVALLLMALTGLYLFWLPFSVKRRKRLAAQEREKLEQTTPSP